MLDTLIVGGGVCGLSLASKLQFAGHEWLLVEARARLGGRVQTVPATPERPAADLGPTWFWPATQPRMARLVEDLGLTSFAQYDSGTVLHLSKGDGSPEPLPQTGVHNGARRVAGGMGAVVEALQQRLAIERIRLGYELTRLNDRGDHVEAHCWTGVETVVVLARRVVLALPPRLVSERVAFEPALESGLRALLDGTPTWMAAQCKALSRFPQAFWRDAGLAGNAFVTHAQAVLGEVFDASEEGVSGAALGGFSALPPSVRSAFRAAHEMMVHSQLAQLYGPPASEGELHLMDWAQERFTCAARDAADPGAHPEEGVVALAEPLWEGRLLLGGSETAMQGSGYLEGALDAAARLWRRISNDTAGAARTGEDESMSNPINQSSLQAFTDLVGRLRAAALPQYVNSITRALSTQHSEGMTQRVVVEVVGTVYAQSLHYLQELRFDLSQARVEQGRCSLTPSVLSAFLGFSDTFLSAVQKHNGTSCAISNFPDEHRPDPAYLQAIRRELAGLWREFALTANEILLDRMAETA